MSRLTEATGLMASSEGRRRLRRAVGSRVVPDRMRHLWRYKEERRLLRGATRSSTEPSGLFFTVHKCASTYVRRALGHLAGHLDLRPVDFASFYYHTTALDTEQAIGANADRIFRPTGYLYAPLRHAIAVPNIDAYRVVVMVRDPRDVLTSLYYSLAVSHGLPANAERRRAFLEMRAEIAQEDIDTFVRRWLPPYQDRFEAYLRLVQEHRCTLLRYEEMLSGFEGWVRRLGAGLGIDVSPADVDALKRLGGFDRPVEENVTRHVRQRAPGDHLRKLTPETVAFLDERLRPVLRGFAYT